MDGVCSASAGRSSEDTQKSHISPLHGSSNGSLQVATPPARTREGEQSSAAAVGDDISRTDQFNALEFSSDEIEVLLAQKVMLHATGGRQRPGPARAFQGHSVLLRSGAV